MKKTFFLLAVVFLLSGKAFSQSPLSVGGTQLNVGAGFSDWGIPFYIGLDFGAIPNITVGGEFSFRSYRENWKNNYYNHNVMGFLGNANYHFGSILNIPQPWDFYAGLNVGFYVWASPKDYTGAHNSGLGLGGQVGARYYFSNSLGLNIEFGSGNAFSGGKIGLSLKI